jgi:hypothetical protein
MTHQAKRESCATMGLFCIHLEFESDVVLNLSSLCWIPKLNNRPYKQRYWSRANFRQVPLIAKLHATRERLWILDQFLTKSFETSWELDNKIICLYLCIFQRIHKYIYICMYRPRGSREYQIKEYKRDMLKVKPYLNNWGTFQYHLLQIIVVY